MTLAQLDALVDVENDLSAPKASTPKPEYGSAVDLLGFAAMAR